jgi:cell division protein FtsB
MGNTEVGLCLHHEGLRNNTAGLEDGEPVTTQRRGLFQDYIKGQQAQIEALKAEIEALKKNVEK